ncbi:MAG: hypothetical protein AABY22_00055 [Nanoarchaeota archaeon]
MYCNKDIAPFLREFQDLFSQTKKDLKDKVIGILEAREKELEMAKDDFNERPIRMAEIVALKADIKTKIEKL